MAPRGAGRGARGTGRRRLPAVRRGRVDALLLVLVLLIAGVVAVRLVAGSEDDRRDAFDGGPAASAGAWLADNAPIDAALLVEGDLRAALVEQGVPTTVLLGPDQVGEASPPDYYVATRTSAGWADDPGPLGDVVARSVPVARFGATSTDGVEVRMVVERPPGEVDVARAAAERTRAGVALARNPAIELTPTASRQLTLGQVDERAMALLATLALDHRLGVPAFPPVPGEDEVGGTRRRIEITSVDGEPVAEGTPRTDDLLAAIGAQQERFAPSEAAVQPARRLPPAPVLAVTFDIAPPAAPPGETP